VETIIIWVFENPWKFFFVWQSIFFVVLFIKHNLLQNKLDRAYTTLLNLARMDLCSTIKKLERRNEDLGMKIDAIRIELLRSK
jgi:hypothetical protein